MAIGLGYHYLVQPKEAVWSEKATRTPQTPLAVDAEDFPEATEYAIKLWNGIMPNHQALFLAAPVETPHGGVRVLSANGAPCGDPWRPGAEEGHSATAYQCPDGTWEIHVSAPGNIHTQLCIIAHELGHVLGLADDKAGAGVMNQTVCPEALRVSDKDAAAVVDRYGR